MVIAYSGELAAIESYLSRLPLLNRQPISLYLPIRDFILVPGKRIRPLLTILAYQLYCSDIEKVMPISVAVECFHNFTLIHDDIIDCAPSRRGSPTVHVLYGQDAAIIAGDVLLVYCYELLLRCADAPLSALVASFSAAARLVCEGQMLDIDFPKRDNVHREEYLEMIKLKTATLLGAALELGAITANAPQTEQKLLQNYGEAIGLVFQLQDDILDLYATSVKSGKATGGDILENKRTILWIAAWENSNEQQKKDLTYWQNQPRSSEKVDAVRNIFDATQARETAQELMQAYQQKANTYLEQLSHRSIERLNQLSQYLLERQQ